MHKLHTLRSLLQATTRRTLLALGLAMGLSACAGVAGASGAGGDTWQEEVLLHDGQKMVMERSQTYGGRSEIGQDAPVADHTVRFTIPKGQQTIAWNSPFDREIGRTSLRLLAVHVKDAVAYVVTEPNLCLSYNKWGRPNPPYVIFKWETNGWQHIGMDALPTEFKTMNVSQRVARMWAKDRNGITLTASQIQAEIATNQPQYRAILRETVANGGSSCAEMVSNGNGAWIGIGWFRDQPTLSACMNYCSREKFDAKTCPCNRLFEGK